MEGGINCEDTNPTGARAGSYKRKKNGYDHLGSSPRSGAEENEDESERRRHPGVKRACNECRQQKLRCDVIQDPFSHCSRCYRLKLECKIESNFKRVGKRSKHAEMEREIEQLRKSLLEAQAQGFVMKDSEKTLSPAINSVYRKTRMLGIEEAVSLSVLKHNDSYNEPRTRHKIENLNLSEEMTNRLFNEFWCCYHPFLPFLSPSQAPDYYYQQHPLLFWAIIAVSARFFADDSGLLTSLSGPLTRLLWTTVGEVPNNLYFVKALCLLCTWPLPTSTTSTDPTHILCGVMMKTATGIGLHRPNHAQDFSRVSVDLNKEQLHERLTTWAVCNIVAQHCGTGYGQPASTLYDWILAAGPTECVPPLSLDPELEAHLQIEHFCDKVSKEIYSNASDSRGVAGDELRAMLTRVYRREYDDLRASVMSRTGLSQLINLHFTAAGLHLCLSAFFNLSIIKGYIDDLMGLWNACISFLDQVFKLQLPSSKDRNQSTLRYSTNYLLQMIVSACFTLLRLLNSGFAQRIDFKYGSSMFHCAIQAIRSISVLDNDLPCRLAELMMQMWDRAQTEQQTSTQNLMSSNLEEVGSTMENSLKLKVRCRMSMSLVYDSIWKWREEFQAQGRSSSEACKKLVNSNFNSESSATLASVRHTTQTNTVRTIPNCQPTQPQILAVANAEISSHNLSDNYGFVGGLSNPGNVYQPETSYEPFDALNWMLDGLMDSPYPNYLAISGLEGGI
ncbi:BgTH12-01657 [Blumeria graminis f. sp. triticale]|uniref:BgTH12-01657 n=2 Tax=Blumeria graminis TaxID=34373 RepID=A0A9W4D4Y6_BLUGR|nr:BgTH12-01657 [Blumeria graminis f. sp. triticale]